ncbi:hypothetical protein POM88_022355 [Heracleum sosnowskyi]|uniref:rRNA N-glycosylase n=1 Tax=Heracleum sosnowskyi TaxID=360622 RepID=A0AAD8IF41_9APIA|nr:hypothetical protein POM88_022355 [Heracleum sosnowskyi]
MIKPPEDNDLFAKCLREHEMGKLFILPIGDSYRYLQGAARHEREYVDIGVKELEETFKTLANYDKGESVKELEEVAKALLFFTQFLSQVQSYGVLEWDINYIRKPCPDNIRVDDVLLKAHKDNYALVLQADLFLHNYKVEIDVVHINSLKSGELVRAYYDRVVKFLCGGSHRKFIRWCRKKVNIDEFIVFVKFELNDIYIGGFMLENGNCFLLDRAMLKFDT